LPRGAIHHPLPDGEVVLVVDVVEVDGGTVEDVVEVVELVVDVVELVDDVVELVDDVVEDVDVVVGLGPAPFLCFPYFSLFPALLEKPEPPPDLDEKCPDAPFTREAREADAAKATQRTNAMLISRCRMIVERIPDDCPWGGDALLLATSSVRFHSQVLRPFEEVKT
jgi:hypothetical protein